MVTQGGKGSSEGKKVQQILTSKYVMGILNWFKIVKNKKIHEAILEIAVNTHSPFCPKLVDYSACVPPALQNGFVNSFDFDNFESHKHSYTQFWSQTLLDFFSLWVTLATLGVLSVAYQDQASSDPFLILLSKISLDYFLTRNFPLHRRMLCNFLNKLNVSFYFQNFDNWQFSLLFTLNI